MEGEGTVATDLVNPALSVKKPAVPAGPDGQLSASRVPYPHQVGGHMAICEGTDGEILKPLVEKEHAFYEKIWADDAPQDIRWLRDFTPRYKGVLDDSDARDPAYGPSKDLCSQWSDSKGKVTSGMSPWAERLSGAQQARERRPRYVRLEDINAGFERPCVMDCKMGTRQFDDDATPEKIARHSKKARETTSLGVGIRVTGMQVFDPKTGHFAFADKHHGRTLREENLVPEFRRFFYDGDQVLLGALDVVRARVQDILSHMERQRTFKFYSSSLLLVYEGGPTGQKAPHAEVRMIDFAHTQTSHGEADEGYLLGIRNLLKILGDVSSGGGG